MAQEDSISNPQSIAQNDNDVVSWSQIKPIPWSQMRSAYRSNDFTNIDNTNRFNASLSSLERAIRQNTDAVSVLGTRMFGVEQMLSTMVTMQNQRWEQQYRNNEENQLEHANDNGSGHGSGGGSGGGGGNGGRSGGGGGGSDDDKPDKMEKPTILGTIGGGLKHLAGTLPLIAGGVEAANLFGHIAQDQHDRDHTTKPSFMDGIAAEATDATKIAVRGSIGAARSGAHMVGNLWHALAGSAAGRATSKAVKYFKGNAATAAAMSALDLGDSYERFTHGDMTGGAIDLGAAAAPWAGMLIGGAGGTLTDEVDGPAGTVGGAAGGLAAGSWAQFGLEQVNTFRDAPNWFGWDNPFYSGYHPFIDNKPGTPTNNNMPGISSKPPSGGYTDSKKVVEIIGSGPNYLIVRLADGSVVKREGKNSRPWRTNNPGDLDYHPWENKFGAIGGDYNGSPHQLLANHHNAVFPDFASGQAAQRELYFGNDRRHPQYRNMTVRDAVYMYAPPNENDTAWYLQEMIRRVPGITAETRLGELNPQQQEQFLKAADEIETGGSSGRETLIKPPAFQGIATLGGPANQKGGGGQPPLKDATAMTGYVNPAIKNLMGNINSVPGGVKYISSVNDAYHRKNVPNSKHTKGLAFDFVLDDPSKHTQATQYLQKMLSEQGVHFLVNDEYDPSKRSKSTTAPHIHVQFNSEQDAARFMASQSTPHQQPVTVGTNLFQHSRPSSGPQSVVVQNFGQFASAGSGNMGATAIPGMPSDLPPSGYQTSDLFTNFL